jgi:hypothetical protein
MVMKNSLDAVLNTGPLPGEFDIYAEAWMYLVSV